VRALSLVRTRGRDRVSRVRPSGSDRCCAVSRFVEIELAQGSIAEVTTALAALSLTFEHTGEAVMLQGGIECAGQPALVRIAAGTLGTCEDFGFVEDANGLAVLVCGEPDRTLLSERLLVPLFAELAKQRLASTVSVAETIAERDGSVRVLLRPRR
jgi:hypothetical protein